MWKTCRRARISVVDRWGVEQQPERKRCEHVRFGGIRRARLGGRRSRSAQFRIAHWMGGPRGAAAAQRRGRRPARRLCEKKRGAGARRAGLVGSAAETVAAAVLELRNACIASGWMVRAGRRPRNGAGDARRGDSRKNAGTPARCTGRRAGGRDGGGRRAGAAQCEHCALARWSARGGGRGMARVTPRAATAGKMRGRRISARSGCVGGRDGAGRCARVAQRAIAPRRMTRGAAVRQRGIRPQCFTLRGRIPLHFAARGRDKME